MLQVSEKEIKNRLAFDNPWWNSSEGIDSDVRNLPKRAYFRPFMELVSQTDVNRAVILLGPRRVGKTVILKQTVQALLDRGEQAERIFYVSIDNPIYTGLGLERLLELFVDQHGHEKFSQLFLLFDEIQYLKDWEAHLKSLIDSYPQFRFVCSGSAAAALRLKSQESGAGRFTEFMLPPLMFSEYLSFIGQEDRLFGLNTEDDEPTIRLLPDDVEELNQEFVRYLNIGGLPEVVYSKTIRQNMERYVREDIVDRVLLSDLPSLYGIADTQGLNRLFAMIAYNTGSEVSLEGLSQASGIAKNTIRRYLDYLEAAFLIHRVRRIDENAKNFERITRFKLYLTNPCLRTSLFGPVNPDDEAMGRLAETALYAQICYSRLRKGLRYARWRNGEVDLVLLDAARQKPEVAVEIKWSDRQADQPEELEQLLHFCKSNRLEEAYVTTRSKIEMFTTDGIAVRFSPVAYWCYSINKQTMEP
ncbi:MAG: ATP-binding protein [Rhodospirillales bacterium]|nr:ATP-binding protein [Rhodospirillales bacterium]